MRRNMMNRKPDIINSFYVGKIRVFSIVKQLLLALMVISPFYAIADSYPQQSVFYHLEHYSNVDTVSEIFENKEIANRLHGLLGADYDTFIVNFDGVGEPHRTPEGGLFIEGWPAHLYIEQASALVIQPDGNLYAAWKKPGIDKIEYRSSQGNADTIQREIVQWASRFDRSSFKDDNRLLPPTSGWFSTKHFDIQLTSLCSEENPYCDNFVYKGIRKSDGAMIRLTGQALRQNCEQSVCPISSYRFRNQDTDYLLDMNNSELVITLKGKTLLKEAGSWLADGF